MAARRFQSEPIQRFEDVLNVQSVPDDFAPKLDPEEKKDGGDEGGLRKLVIKSEKSEAKDTQAEVDPSTLVVDLEEVFSLGYITQDSFVKKLKDAQKKAKDKNVEPRTIDFGMEGYITDTTIKSLVQTLGKEALSKIIKVSLEGCSILTDIGLHWLAQGLAGNTQSIQVNINGCTKVTDGGLAALVNAPNIGHVDAMATAVCHLKHAGNTKGCPLLVSPKKTESEVRKEGSVIILPMGNQHSLAEFVQSKTAKGRQPFHYKRSVELSDWKVNITEVEKSHVLFEHTLPPNPVHVIIPFDARCEVQQLTGQVVDTIAHILSKEKVNPKHLDRKHQKMRKLVTGSNGFMNIFHCGKCSCHDGIFRNTSNNSDILGAVISSQPLSRTNNYFEIQVITAVAETGVIIGIMHDVIMTDRYPLDSRERLGGAVDGHELEEGAVYGFGVSGNWLSEYVPDDDATYYFTKNGIKLTNKKTVENPHIGMFPIVALVGKDFAAVKLLNQASPPQAVLQQQAEKELYWTPGFLHKILCDDRGILSYVDNYKSADNVGLMVCQEVITRENNSFTIKILERASGIVTMGLGPENYTLNRQPGWDKSSIGLHGDNGKVYVETGSGAVSSSGECRVWQNGDVVQVVVSSMGENDTIQPNDEVQVDFFVNKKKMATVTHKFSGLQTGIRIVFIVGLRGKGVKVQMMNHRCPYFPPPPQMDMLTMGRSNFMNIYDDGRIAYRKFDKRDFFGLFMSKTPFNKKLTYFEMKVEHLGGPSQHAGIGLVPRMYPVNNMAGWLEGSLGYHADNGQLYSNTSSGIRSLLDSGGGSAAAYTTGDVVGCGFDEKKAKFREDGSLESQQTLHFYFTKNGKKVHEVAFEYLCDGIFPAVNLHYEPDTVILRNYDPSAANGEIPLDSKAKKVPEKEEDEFIEGCRFTLVGMGQEGSDPAGKIQLLQQQLGEKLHFPVMSEIDNHIQLMESDPKMMDLQGQQLYGQLCWQKECLERFIKNCKSRLKFLSTDVSSGKGHQELVDHIVSVFEMDLANHSGIYDIHKSVYDGFTKILTSLAKEKLMVSNKLSELVGSDLGNSGKVFEAAIRYLQSKGHLMWVPMKRTVLAIDMGLMEKMVGLTASDTLSGKMAPCIGENTKVWNKVSEILPSLQQFSEEKMELLSHAFLFLGVMEIPRLRTKKGDPMFCYCTPQTLGDLPVTVADFIHPESSDVVLVQRKYHFLYSSPATILSMIVTRCLLFSSAVAIAHDWCVFQSGAAQTVIYISGEQGLCVETRCYMPDKKKEHIDYDTLFHVEEYVFNIFCIFVDLIDLIITRLKVKAVYTSKTPLNMVNTSVGCIHSWGLSDEDFRQTLCTLCGQCCDKGRSCPYNGVGGEYRHQCGCGTLVTGCKDCGICEHCADSLWTIRSYLRPNLEVASYGKMKSNSFIPLNATTYDEIEFTNLGIHQIPVCLKTSTGTSQGDSPGSLVKLFPQMATEFPSQQSLIEHMTQQTSSSNKSGLMTFNQGDTVTIKLDPVKRDSKTISQVEEESPLEINPVYFTAICRECTVWHDTGIVAYTSASSAVPVGQFIGASPLTKECPAFSFEIVNPGEHCYIAVGVCHKRYPPDRQPGWNSGSVGYHADDGGVFISAGWPAVKVAKCTTGDIMKCEVNFDTHTLVFYKNGTKEHETKPQRNTSNFHPAVGFHSVGEAVRLLEKEPWQISGDEEACIPGRTLSMKKVKNQIAAWLMLHNPSKSIVGYRLPPSIVKEAVGYLEPAKCLAVRLSLALGEAETTRHVDIHWFLLESNRDYSDVDIGKIYNATTSESLLKHRLKVTVTDVVSADSKPLKLASEEPDANDCYLAEVFKNGISVQKYWLKGGNYVCSLPQSCSVLVRYPKFPTLDQPNGFQKGMRVIVSLTETQKDLYAEAVIEEATADGYLRLEYSQPDGTVNACMETSITSPEIAIKEIEYEDVTKAVPDKSKSDSDAKGDKAPDTKLETEKVAALSLISFQPRGHIAVTKRAYVFPPFHLLTEATQAAITSIDSAWKANTLNSVAQCKNVPTRLTVQELQISLLVGSNLEWLSGANPSHKFDLAFAFLPSNMGHKELCYPTIPSIFQNVDVYRLCFLVDQMYYNQKLVKDYNIMLDAPMHFVNVQPIPPKPSLSAESMFASAFNGWTYSTLYSNRLYLPQFDNMFPGGKPDFKKAEMEHLMKSLVHVYAAQCHIFAEQHGGLAFQATPEDGTGTIVKSIDYKDKEIIRKTDKVELSSEVLIKKAFRNNVFCKAHQWCLPGTNMLMEEEFDFRSELFTPYEEAVNLMYRASGVITSVRTDLYSIFPNLQYLKLEGYEKLSELPDGISKCLRLEMVSVKNNAIEVLPSDLFEIPCLKRLHCVDLRVKTLPNRFMEHSPITELILSNMLLTSVPKELGKLVNLEYLNLNSNPLETLPMELASLTKLKTLLLSGIPWLVIAGSKVEMPLDQFEDFLKTNSSLKNYLGKEKLVDLFHEYDHNKNSRLDSAEVAALNTHLFWNVPHVGGACINCTEYGGIPPVIFLLSGLETLHLDFQAITAVPVHMCRLQNLKMLSVSNNPLLESLPGALGHLPSLKSLRLVSNPSLRTPPHEVVSRGFAAIKAYLKRLAGGFTECRRTKLMLVGLGGAGKTSLLRAIMSSNKKTAGTRGEDITNGIDILPWTVKTSDGVEVTYSTWDFAGQTLYYNTHQFFLSKRAVYLLLWSTRQGFEHSGLEFWLSSIASHAPDTPIFVVGTHCDQVPKADIPMDDLQERYPQIAGFHFVSSVEGIGIAKLEQDLLRVTLEQKNMGEKVPKVWLNMEKKILECRSTTSILPWKVIKDFGMEVGIYDDKDIREAIQFLHELGTVQYFDNEFLRDQVVINPQWIVNVMSCVVSVKNSPIQEHSGRFLHKYIPTIWGAYPASLHPWLLRLTEEFDLTFPMPEDGVNIVPCLLPHEMPKDLQWPVADIAKNLKETKLVYKFTYLPTGLFNRAQVRLFQLSDGKLIWKRGSLLKKNRHQALISQTSDSELQVKVQGPRPENVIFLIHEIFESLIQESFHGVIYEFLVPCPDCIVKEGTLEPSMFEGSLVSRAKEHRAPFLQCRKYFHTISMAQLDEVMPSSSDSDFDAHLQNSLSIMQQLNSDLSTDVAIIYSARDMVRENDPTRISPEKIKNDIEAAGFSCWFSSTMDKASVQDVMLALKNCKIVIALLSNNFERDDRSHDLLLYTMDTLNKDVVIVVISDATDWENTDLGMRIGKQEEMVMMKNKSRYDARVGDMVTAVQSKLKQNQIQVQQHPSVFISYCWSNSRHAHSRGTKCPPGAIGWGDPREVKVELERRGLSCWIDFDQPAGGKGLFKNITEGIRNSKVLVVFVSDEYVKSDNCMMEVRFGVLNMNLPTIIAVVGTGKEWKLSEMGILMQRSKADKVYMQEENPSALDILEKYIKQRLPENVDKLVAKNAVKQTMKSLQQQEKNKHEKKSGKVGPDKSAIQEEYELMQRKFMRYIISYVSSMDSAPTPRLIIVDFEKHERGSNKARQEMDSTDGTVRSSTLRPTLRPKTASRSSRLMNVVLEDEDDKWESEAFCLKLMCEDERGWHVCKKSFPVKMTEEFKNQIKKCSAYLARMFAILRQSAVNLNCFDGQMGDKFTAWIEQNAVDNVNFLDAYTELRTRLVEDDTAQEFLAQLHRCHLPTGKIYWLCNKHSMGPRITRLSTESATRSEVGRVIYEEDIKMKDLVEHSDIYIAKKRARNPSAGIVLPQMLTMLTNEASTSDESQALLAALAANQKPEPKAEQPPKPKETPANNTNTNNNTRRASQQSSRDQPQPKPEARKASVKPAARAISAVNQKNKGSKTCSLQ